MNNKYERASEILSPVFAAIKSQKNNKFEMNICKIASAKIILDGLLYICDAEKSGEVSAVQTAFKYGLEIRVTATDKMWGASGDAKVVLDRVIAEADSFALYVNANGSLILSFEVKDFFKPMKRSDLP